MSELFVFADETGTMPTRDQDRPFCAATVATFGKAPAIETRSGRLADVLRAIDFAKVAYILPQVGYEAAALAKNTEMNKMARATQLTTGANAYLPDIGHNLGNIVWSRCMGPALCGAVLFGIAKGPVNRIQIVLDQKSMVPPTRAMFVDSIQDTIDSVRTYITEAEPDTGTDRVVPRQNMRFDRSSVSVTWSDEKIPPEWEAGLFLADRLGYHTYRSLRGKGITLTELADMLDRFAPTGALYDATAEVIKPVAHEVIEEWRKNFAV